MANIGDVVHALRRGERARRAGWNGKGMEIAAVMPEARGDKAGTVICFGARLADLGTMTAEPFVVMKTAQGTVIPWLCSQADLLANDWEIIGMRTPTKEEIDACPSSEPNRDADD